MPSRIFNAPVDKPSRERKTPLGLFDKTRRECWRIIDERYPEPKDKYTITKELIERIIKSGNKILDAGCGHRSIISDYVQVTRIGIDAVFEDVKRNKSIDFGICSNLEFLPLKDASVDIVLSNMVFEHMRNPDSVFAEFNRVLKKGGYLIFMTPNLFNIVTILNLMIPNRFHPSLANALTGSKKSDVFPTYYRTNSVGRLRKLLNRNGFEERELILYQPPPYAFVFSKAICKFTIRFYHFINRHDALSQLRGVIISRYQKD
jgi:ubiquinone/menaquinone biosynthesis C-methylase UbiE